MLYTELRAVLALLRTQASTLSSRRSQIADSAHTIDEAHKLARKFTEQRSPVAIALARQMLWRNTALPHPLEAHRIDSLAVFYAQLADGKEGVQAFLDKRAPQFSSKASQMPPIPLVALKISKSLNLHRSAIAIRRPRLQRT